jgi:hypothetical protein
MFLACSPGGGIRVSSAADAAHSVSPRPKTVRPGVSTPRGML